MSLYVGNLSPGVRLAELERVFQKFGRCSVRMKNGYGFVDYDFPPDSERALRALRDKDICGEQLTLSWSNRRSGAKRERVRAGRVRGSNGVGEGLGRRENADEDGAGTENGGDVAMGENAGRGRIREHARNRSSGANAEQGCYHCGAVGHIMRDCPRGYFSGRKLYRFESRRGEENKRKEMGREEIERSRSRPKKRMRYSQDSGPVGREMSGGKLPRRSPARNEDDDSQRNCYEGKQRRRKETEFVKECSRRLEEKSSLSSRLDSDRNTLRSNSKSRLSNHKRGYYSLSSSSRVHSASSSSRSRLPGRNGRYNGLKSRSRSVSPTDSTLSVSICNPSPCSPNRAERTAEMYSDDVVDPAMNGGLIEQGRMSEVGVLLEDTKPENWPEATNDKLTTLPSKMDKMEQDEFEENTETCEKVFGSADDESRESGGPEDDTFVGAGNSLEHRLTGTKYFQNCDGLTIEGSSHSPINTKDHGTSYISPSTEISSEELTMVLKHYGFSILDESRIDLSLEDYFGSARLWPWGVIFYRRLKKGLISLQNYARRVEQNREFGIMDNHIRSSSGWGEPGQGNL